MSANLPKIYSWLTDTSFFRYVPTQADTAVFDAMKGKAPAKDKYPHAARWYAHIQSFEASGRKQFPKSKKAADSYLGGAGGDSKADEDDDDVDLFGSDDEEEDAEAAKIREERLAAYAGELQIYCTLTCDKND